jgi:DNA-binding LacI/PurR family transcriptional regulator
VKQDAVVDYVRHLIISGGIKPGGRLPTRVDLERRFQVSPVTMQRALDRLVADGFVTVAGNIGTFAAEFPPHLHRYALVFPERRDGPRWSRFWSLLAAEAEARSRDLPLGISLYTGIEPGCDDAEIARLTEDLAAQRLSGLVFACDPWPLKSSPILELPGVPRVAFASLDANTAVPSVALGGDGKLFFRRAVDHLVARGRRRIALLTVPGLSGAHLETYRAILDERGLEYQPWRVQVGLQAEPHWAAHLTMLMFRDGQEERPDGLIIADDHLVEHACAGLAELGLAQPAAVEVVGHANFPLPRATATAAPPIARLGYDIPGAFATCLDLLAVQRAGRRAPTTTVIAPLFVDELSGRAARRDAQVAL